MEVSTMDNSILKKKLSTFRTAKGKLTRVSEDILVEVIKTWETWPGTSSDMARDLGLTMRQLVILVEKAKKLIREGDYPMNDFKEIKLDGSSGSPSPSPGPCHGIELCWESNKVIRFAQVEQLVDFLKKVA
jgi:hypothetical protein